MRLVRVQTTGGAEAVSAVRRWANWGATRLWYDQGLFDVGMSPLLDMAGGLFNAAGVAWTMLDVLFGMARTGTVLAVDVGAAVDRVSLGMAELLLGGPTGGGVAWAVALTGLMMALFMSLRRGVGATLKSVATTVVCLSFIVALVVAPAGSLLRPTNMATFLLDKSAALANVGLDVGAAPASKAAGCEAYIDAMEGGATAAPRVRGRGSADAAERAVVTRERDRVLSEQTRLVSRFWRSTFFPVWASAQFGEDAELAQRAACHQLEANIGAPVEEQKRFAKAAYGMSSEPGAAVVGPWPSKDLAKAAMVAWAWCEPDGSGGFKEAPQFAKVKKRDASGYWESAGVPSQSTSTWCKKWWDDNTDKLDSLDGDGSLFWFDDGDDIVTATNENKTDSAAARGYLEAATGHNGGAALILAALAVLLSIMFLWSFGRLALAMAFSTVLVALELVFAPFAVIPAMLPTQTSRRFASQYVRAVLGTVAVASGVWILFALFVAINSLLTTIAFAGLDNPGWVIDAAIRGGIPCVTFITMRKIARRRGLAHVFTLRGNMKMAGQALRGRNPYNPDSGIDTSDSRGSNRRHGGRLRRAMSPEGLLNAGYLAQNIEASRQGFKNRQGMSATQKAAHMRRASRSLAALKTMTPQGRAVALAAWAAGAAKRRRARGDDSDSGPGGEPTGRGRAGRRRAPRTTLADGADKVRPPATPKTTAPSQTVARRAALLNGRTSVRGGPKYKPRTHDSAPPPKQRPTRLTPEQARQSRTRPRPVPAPDVPSTSATVNPPTTQRAREAKAPRPQPPAPKPRGSTTSQQQRPASTQKRPPATRRPNKGSSRRPRK
jgi:hypothetical protein